METLHFERSTNYIGPFQDPVNTLISKVKSTGQPSWVAVGGFYSFATEHIRDLLANDYLAEAERFVMGRVNPMAHGMFRYLISETMDRIHPVHSLHSIVSDDEFNTFLSWYDSFASKDEFLEGNYRTVFMHHAHVASLEKSGRRVYEVSSGLGDRLLYTELRGLQCEDLRLPYESIYIVTPPELGFRVWNQETEWHEVEGIYIWEDFRVPLNGAGVPVKDDANAVRGWRVMIVGKSKNLKNPFDDALFYFLIPLPTGVSIDSQLEKIDKEAAEHPHAMNMRDETQRIFRWCMNVVFYATMPEADSISRESNGEVIALRRRIENLPKRCAKSDRLRQRLKHLPHRITILLGRTVKRMTETSVSNGRSMSVVSRVSGHWKRVVVGVRAEGARKLTWVAPYLRGYGEVISPIHRMRE